MPQYTDHLWSEDFLGLFKHSFLIRDPAKVLTSVYKNWPEFAAKEIGFEEQRALFDRLWERDGRAPPVIDSDDLMEDPTGVVEAYCAAVGIPFLPEALSWEPGARAEVLWYDKEQVWHKNLINSDGLKPQPRKTVDITETPDWVQEMHAAFLPHYEHLRAQRLRVPKLAKGLGRNSAFRPPSRCGPHLGATPVSVRAGLGAWRILVRRRSLVRRRIR